MSSPTLDHVIAQQQQQQRQQQQQQTEPQQDAALPLVISTTNNLMDSSPSVVEHLDLDNEQEEDLDSFGEDDDDDEESDFDQLMDDAFDDVDDRPGVKNLKLDIDYVNFLGRLLKDFPKIAVARLEEVARENYLMREDKEEMKRLTEDLDYETKGYRIHTVQPGRTTFRDASVEERSRIATDTYVEMMKLPAALEGLKSIDISISRIDVIDNKHLESLFDNKKERLRESGRPCEEIMLFHGTAVQNEQSILVSNFDLRKGKRKAFGEGIYLSELPSASLFYGDSLFLCRVLPGLVQQSSSSSGGKIFDPELFDSLSHWHQAKGRGNYVIKEPCQILPYCIIRVKKDFSDYMKKKYQEHLAAKKS